MKKIEKMLNDTEIRSEAAKKKAELVRDNHTKCDCCSKEINNSKYLDFDEHNKCDAYLYPNGYLYSYYLWDNKFLCQKCFNRTSTMEFIMKQPLAAAILVLIYIPLSLFDYVKKIVRYLSFHSIWMCRRIYSKCVRFMKYRYRRMCRLLSHLPLDVKKKLLDIEDKILEKEFDFCMRVFDYLYSKKNCKCVYELRQDSMVLFDWHIKRREQHAERHHQYCKQNIYLMEKDSATRKAETDEYWYEFWKDDVKGSALKYLL